MNLDKLNNWLALIANIGVVAGLVFLALELQQNSKLAERELAISRANNIHGSFVSNDFLSEVVMKVTAIQGTPEIVQAYQDAFDMSEPEAYRYWRHIFQLWLHEQADWVYRGRQSNSCDVILLRFLDQQIFFRYMQGNLDTEFVTCINKWYVD